MKISKYLITTSVFCLASIFPLKAFSERIPFYVSNNTDKNWQVCCAGPWGRASSTLNITSNENDKKFYSAETTIFSPFGKWTCPVSETSGIIDCGDLNDIGSVQQCEEKGVECVKFCLENIPDAEVDLTIDEQSVTVNFTKDCDTTLTQANLGDGGTSFTVNRDALRLHGILRNKVDRDTFSFQGTEGDEVTITIEKNLEKGHMGEQATLILQDAIDDVSLYKTETDSLPHEIIALLPATGEYKIVVQQTGIPEEVRFRGDYLLHVKSSLGDINVIKPSEDVEN